MTRTLIEDLPGMLDDVGAWLRSGDVSPAFRECHEIAAEDVAWHFSKGETPDGRKWPARKDNLPHQLLILSGKLFAASTGGAGHLSRIDNRSMTYGVSGSAVFYAGFQNFGTRYIPSREFMGLSESAENQCAEVLADYVLQAI